MPKPARQDVVPTKRSIREVSLHRRSSVPGPETSATPSRPKEAELSASTTPPTRPPAPPIAPPPSFSQLPPRPQSRLHRFRLWGIALIAIGILYFTFAFFFVGAEVVVTPRQATVALSGTFEATQSENPIGITYELMSISRTASRTLQGTGEEFVEKKASGNITVYNDFNSSPQTLVATTRFESPEGLIFRIPEEITVPGQMEIGGKVQPGSVTTTVFADKTGAEYNIGPTVFTIPGFKGSARYSNFSAESVDPMSGGFAGTIKVVAGEDEINAREEIAAELVEQLKREVSMEIPNGFLLYDDAFSFEVIAHPNTVANEETNMVSINGEVVLRVPIFKESELSRFIAQQTIAGFDNGEVTVTNLRDLNFTLLGNDSTAATKDPDFSFSLTGNPHIVWVFDVSRLRDDFAGKEKRLINTVLSGYPGIEKAEVTIRPFWSGSFPKNPSKIDIETTLTSE